MSYAAQPEARYVHREEHLTVHTIIGVYEWEREAVRPLVLCFQITSSRPLNLSRTLIEESLCVWLAPCRYRLLEALAEYITQCMFTEWHCTHIVLEIEKPGALGELARVGICFTRQRRA